MTLAPACGTLELNSVLGLRSAPFIGPAAAIPLARPALGIAPERAASARGGRSQSARDVVEALGVGTGFNKELGNRCRAWSGSRTICNESRNTHNCISPPAFTPFGYGYAIFTGEDADTDRARLT
jgi:hypothetical protein